MFYFARFLIKLKKSGSALGKRTGQSALEYLLLFAAIAVIALLSMTAYYKNFDFFGKSQQTTEKFYNKTAEAIMGSQVEPIDLAVDESQQERITGSGKCPYSTSTGFPYYNVTDPTCTTDEDCPGARKCVGANPNVLCSGTCPSIPSGEIEGYFIECGLTCSSGICEIRDCQGTEDSPGPCKLYCIPEFSHNYEHHKNWWDYGCQSDWECYYSHHLILGYPLIHCDDTAATPLCVQCTDPSHCAVGYRCDSQHKCVSGCDENIDCADTPATPYCNTTTYTCGACPCTKDPPPPYCLDNNCVECRGHGDCNDMQICSDNECINSPKDCKSDNDCIYSKVIVPGPNCEHGICVECDEDVDCQSASYPDATCSLVYFTCN